MLQFPLQFILKWDHHGPEICSPTHSISPLWGRTILVMWTYGLNSYAWSYPKLSIERSTRSSGQDLSGQIPFRPSSILSPSLKFPSISPSFVPPGAKQNKPNHSSWQLLDIWTKWLCLSRAFSSSTYTSSNHFSMWFTFQVLYLLS